MMDDRAKGVLLGSRHCGKLVLLESTVSLATFLFVWRLWLAVYHKGKKKQGKRKQGKKKKPCLKLCVCVIGAWENKRGNIIPMILSAAIRLLGVIVAGEVLAVVGSIAGKVVPIVGLLGTACSIPATDPRVSSDIAWKGGRGLRSAKLFNTTEKVSTG